MPTYTAINNLQVPVGSDPPNVVGATHPVATGAERRCFNFMESEDDLDLLLPDPSEGMVYYNDAHRESLVFIDGSWRAASPLWRFHVDSLLITGTSFTSIMSVALQPRSIYRIEGTFMFDSEDDSVEFRLRLDPTSTKASYWRLENSLGAYATTSTYTPSVFSQSVSFHTAVMVTSSGTDSDLILEARKTADTGGDCDVFEGFMMVQRMRAWVGA